jgi:hypothetical protein
MSPISTVTTTWNLPEGPGYQVNPINERLRVIDIAPSKDAEDAPRPVYQGLELDQTPHRSGPGEVLLPQAEVHPN